MLYEQWTKDESIGGVLSNYVDTRRVRVYIKDTLLKDYVRNTRSDATLPFRALELSATEAEKAYFRGILTRLGLFDT